MKKTAHYLNFRKFNQIKLHHTCIKLSIYYRAKILSGTNNY